MKTIASQVPTVEAQSDKGNTLPIHTALTSTALGDAPDGAKKDPKEIVRRLNVNRGHASAQQLKRTMAEADGKAGKLIPSAGDVVRECEICRASDAAPAIPVAGTSHVSSFNEKVRADLLFLGDLVALRVIDHFPRYSLSVPVRPGNPEGVWDAFCDSRIAVFGKPRLIQMDAGGEWGLCADWFIFAPIGRLVY